MAVARYDRQNIFDTEADTWRFLEWLQAIDKSDSVNIRNIGRPSWANVNWKYTGRIYESTITPPIMEALLSFQSGIHRSFALAKYGTAKASTLTEDDKRNTQIVVKINEGSTGISLNGAKVLNHFVDVMGHSMNGTEATLVSSLVVVCFFGVIGAHVVINKVYEAKMKKYEEDGRAAQRSREVEQTIALSKEDTKRSEILANLSNNFLEASIVQSQAIESATSLLKSVRRDESLGWQDLKIPGSVAADILHTSKTRTKQDLIKSVFKIVSAKGDTAGEFKAKIRDMSANCSTEREYIATLKDQFLSKRQGEIVQSAFWNRKLVRLTIDARILRGKVIEAEIIEAVMLEEDAPS